MRYVTDNHEKEQAIRLSIIITGDGSAHIVGRDEDGDEWRLLEFQTSGKVYRWKGLPDNIGFDVDDRGRIMLFGEE